MTQPNQSELDSIQRDIWARINDEAVTRGIQISIGDAYCLGTVIKEVLHPRVRQLITANYTPNTKLKALIEASEKLNLEFHGRPDCKNCSLQEQLAELIKAKEDV